MTFGEKLKELREDKGLKQKELAKIIGVSSNAISNYETDTNFPVHEIRIKLVKYFDVSLDYLLGAIDEYAPLDRSRYIMLPRHAPMEFKDDLMEQYELLKLKYKL